MTDIYPYSVFYFPYSLFQIAGKSLLKNIKHDSVRVLFRATLLNTRYKKVIGMHITFTTEEILEFAKSDEFAHKFVGFMQLGSNIAFPEDVKNIRGDRNFKLLQRAIDRDGEIKGIVKIVAEDKHTIAFFKKKIEEDKYPLMLVSCEDCLKEMEIIDQKLKDFPFEVFSK